MFRDTVARIDVFAAHRDVSLTLTLTLHTEPRARIRGCVCWYSSVSQRDLAKRIMAIKNDGDCVRSLKRKKACHASERFRLHSIISVQEAGAGTAGKVKVCHE